MSRTIKLSFITDMDQVVSMSIPRAKDGLASNVAAVKDAMDRIIATKIINTTAGTPKTRKKAEIVDVRTEAFGVNLDEA